MKLPPMMLCDSRLSPVFASPRACRTARFADEPEPQGEVLMGQGLSRIDAIRRIGVVELSSYRLRKQYGGMGVDQLKELKRLQQ